MARRVLALVTEAVSGAALQKVMGGEDAEQAEVLVVAPALDKRYRFWLSDPDRAIYRAEEVQEETVQRMVEEGIDAAGDTGESDPLLALQDALATFQADEIVLFVHPDGEQNWLEDGLVAQAQERFSVPVRHVVVKG